MDNKTKGISKPLYGVILIAAVILIAILVNLIFSLFPESIRKPDLSSEQLSRVSDEAAKYLSESLDGKIEIYHIAEGGMEDETLCKFLKNLAKTSENISYKFLDVTVQRSLIEKLTETSPDDVQDNTLVVKGEKYSSKKIISPETLYTYETFRINADSREYEKYGEFSYREFVSVYSSLSDEFEGGYAYYENKFSGENTLISAIDYVTTDPEKLPKIYFTVMHGEDSVSESLAELLSLSNLDAQPLTFDKEIPEDAAVIIINAPTSDFTEAEAKMLENYLKNGGKLFVMTAPSNVASLKNLTKVLESYGLTYEDKELREGNSAYHYPGYPHYLLPSADMLAQLYGVSNRYIVMSSPHAIKFSSADTNITAQKLLVTTKSAYYEKNDNGEKCEEAQYTIAMSVSKKDGGEIFWFGSPYMLTEEDDTLTGGGNYAHFTAILSSICDIHTFDFASKLTDTDVITISSGQANFWAVTVIGIIPVSVFIFGAVRVGKRRKA